MAAARLVRIEAADCPRSAGPPWTLCASPAVDSPYAPAPQCQPLSAPTLYHPICARVDRPSIKGPVVFPVRGLTPLCGGVS